VGDEKYRYVRSLEEMEVALARQLGHLRRSCEAFDREVFEEAERIAGILYILLHKGWRQQPLIEFMKGFEGLEILNTSREQHIGMGLDGIQKKTTTYGLCFRRYEDKGSTYLPNFISSSPLYSERLPLADWWNKTIFWDSEGLELSRKNLVQAIRYQDGGGHVDLILENKAYHSAILAGTLEHPLLGKRLGSITVYDSAIISSFTSIEEMRGKYGHWSSIRQIAWELEEAFSHL
jgi:hypothetical protein